MLIVPFSKHDVMSCFNFRIHQHWMNTFQFYFMFGIYRFAIPMAEQCLLVMIISFFLFICKTLVIDVSQYRLDLVFSNLFIWEIGNEIWLCMINMRKLIYLCKSAWAWGLLDLYAKTGRGTCSDSSHLSYIEPTRALSRWPSSSKFYSLIESRKCKND